VQLIWRRSFRFVSDILDGVASRSPHLVHLQHEFNMYGGKSCAPLFPVLLRGLRRQRVPTVITVHGVPSRASLDDAFGQTFLPPALRLPLAMRLSAPVVTWIFRRIVREADQIIVHASILGRYLVEDYGADPAILNVIPIGVAEAPLVEAERRPTAPWVSRCEATPFLICFGYVARRKGIELLFEAYARLTSATRPPIVLAGAARDADYLDELLTRARELGIESDLIVTGALSAHDIDWLLRRAVAALFSYRFSISASGPLSIAMGYSVPAIAPASGVFNDDLQHEVDSLLYVPGDADSYASAIQRLITDTALRERLAEGSRRKAAARSWSKVAARTREVYDIAFDRSSSRY
jgi:glycosyltransferase involved in cell wall biosynthesis